MRKINSKNNCENNFLILKSSYAHGKKKPRYFAKLTAACCVDYVFLLSNFTHMK